MRIILSPILAVTSCLLIVSVTCELFHGYNAGDASSNGDGPLMANSMEKTGLDKTVNLINKRAYYYGTSGPGKRLPNYDFGLGKRGG